MDFRRNLLPVHELRLQKRHLYLFNRIVSITCESAKCFAEQISEIFMGDRYSPSLGCNPWPFPRAARHCPAWRLSKSRQASGTACICPTWGPYWFLNFHQLSVTSAKQGSVILYPYTIKHYTQPLKVFNLDYKCLIVWNILKITLHTGVIYSSIARKMSTDVSFYQ